MREVFWCNGKKGICESEVCPDDCEWTDGTGGEFIMVEDTEPPKEG